MVQKQTVNGRMTQLSMANLDAILEYENDPLPCLDDLIHAYTQVVIESNELIVTTIGQVRLAEADHAEDVAAAMEWEREANGARKLARDARSFDHSLEAEQFTALATYAAGKQASFEASARQSAPHIAAQTERVKELRSRLAEIETKLENLRDRAAEISATLGPAVPTAVNSRSITINVFDPTSELSLFRERVHRVRRTME